MRAGHTTRWSWAVAALVVSSGCNLIYDADQVPPPCVPACASRTCGEDDGCGQPCAPEGRSPGCTPACTPVCAQRYCGTDNGCGSPCVFGGPVPGCTPITGLHRLKDSRFGSAGSARDPAGHSADRGQLGSSTPTASPGGHSVRRGGVTP